VLAQGYGQDATAVIESRRLRQSLEHSAIGTMPGVDGRGKELTGVRAILTDGVVRRTRLTNTSFSEQRMDLRRRKFLKFAAAGLVAGGVQMRPI
jgi:hypothetical protein